MIIDTLTAAANYFSVLPGLREAFAFIRETDFTKLADGRYPIAGEKVYAMLQSYETKPAHEGYAEAHRRYADIQVVLQGRELVGYAPLLDQPEVQPYDKERDVLFVAGPTTLLTLEPGMFMLLLPQDAHLPGRSIDAAAPIRKVVVKVEVPQ